MFAFVPALQVAVLA